MVERDGRDDGDFGHDDVGRVEPPAKPRLNDGDVTAFSRKLKQGHRGHELEKTWVILRRVAGNCLSHGLQFPRVGNDFRLGERHAADLHALAEPHQMWRSV